MPLYKLISSGLNFRDCKKTREVKDSRENWKVKKKNAILRAVTCERNFALIFHLIRPYIFRVIEKKIDRIFPWSMLL